MKTIILVGLAVWLVLSEVALPQQAGEEKKGSSMQDLMQGMMKGGQSGEGEMKGMDGMMRMMKIIEQCSAMMESSHDQGDKAKESNSK